MSKRFITKNEMVDTLDPQTMRDYIKKILQHVDDCQANNLNPNLERLGHDLIKTSFEFGLVELNSGCSSCSGGCPTSQEKPAGLNKGPGKVIPFKKLH